MMSFVVKSFDVKSSDKIHFLKGKLYVPTGEIKGLFHIVHGMTEHIDRYDHLMSCMAEKGFLAFGFDNLGHGKTALNDAELGFFAHKNGWKFLVEDVLLFGNAVRQEYPQKPLCLMGHSMGSFIARLAAEKYPDYCQNLIICGTSGKNPLAYFGLALTVFIKTLFGEKHISDLCQNAAFGSYNKGFSEDSLYGWLTKDKEIIEKYKRDKFCTFRFSVSGLCDLMKLVINCNKNSWYKNIKKDTPVLLISGEDDPVGNYSKGVKQVYSNLLKEGCRVKMRLFEGCRHEIHNDTCKGEVIAEILEFTEQMK